MLLSKDFLFLHFPKTAGKSLTKYFIGAWPGPIYGLVSRGQIKELADDVRPDITLEVGSGHENMENAQSILTDRGQRIQDLRAIFTCIRNPYDLAVSTYFFMRKTFRNNTDKPRFRMAMEQGFEDFWCNDQSRGIPENWLTLNGKTFENQVIIRFETLDDDLDRLAEEFNFCKVALPHLNPSEHGHYSEYVTALAERAIYNKFRYLFDAGYYTRETFG